MPAVICSIEKCIILLILTHNTIELHIEFEKKALNRDYDADLKSRIVEFFLVLYPYVITDTQYSRRMKATVSCLYTQC